MPKQAVSVNQKQVDSQTTTRSPTRTYPRHSLKEALTIINAIGDKNASKEMDRLLLADAIGRKPTSSDYRDLLSSSRAYGLTVGTEKAEVVKPTPLGISIINPESEEEKNNALKTAILGIEPFSRVLNHFNRAKFPDSTFFKNILSRQFKIPTELTSDFEKIFTDNCNYVGFFRQISGSTMVMINNSGSQAPPKDLEHHDTETKGLDIIEGTEDLNNLDKENEQSTLTSQSTNSPAAQQLNKPIFIGHGKNRKPLEKLEKMLSTFKIPFKVTISEANLGRPIPKKVRDTMLDCGSAILIFTRDEMFKDKDENEIWRPSENVVHELGAASFAYEDRIVVFKEKGVSLASNYSSLGYIEFEIETMEAQSMDLLKELIGFGLVKITPA